MKRPPYLTRNLLKKLIYTMTFTDIAKHYNVSVNTVKNWCDFFDLPRNKSDIKLFDELEWYSI